MDSPLLEGIQNSFAGLVAFLILFLPLLAIPWAFKLAGGIIGRVNEFLGGYGSKITEAIKGNPNDPFSARNRVRNNLFDKIAMNRQEVVQRGEKAGASRFQKIRGAVAGSFLFPDARQRVSMVNKRAQEMREVITNFNDDSDVYAGGGYRLGKGTVITQDMANTLLGYNGQKIFSQGQVGTQLSENMNFDAKGRRITNNLYNAGKRLRGATASQVAESIGYAAYKGQTDRERSAMRMAFAYNAHQNNWSSETMGDMWAKAVYGKKDIDVTQWYSQPKWQVNPGTGQREVVFNDVSDKSADGLASYNKMTEEFNQSRTSFAITPDRDGAMRAMLDRQRQLEEKADLNGYLSPQEHVALVKTHQIFDAISTQMYKNTDQGMVTAQGTPEAQAVIKAAIAERKLNLSDYDATTGSRTFTRNTGGPAIAVRDAGGNLVATPAVSDAANRPNVARRV